MKIGILCHNSCGGSSRVAINKALELSKMGYEVHVFSRSYPFFLQRIEHSIKCHSLYQSQSSLDYSLLKVNWSEVEMQMMQQLIVTIIQQQNLDILHVHYAIPFAHICHSVKKQLKDDAPVMILTLHGTDLTNHKNNLSYELLKCFDQITTVSYAYAKLAEHILDLPVKPIIIHNFIETKKYKSLKEKMNTSCMNIIHISNFRPIKNPEGIITIFNKIIKEIPAKLILVGSGPEMPKIKKLIAINNLDNLVTITGLLNNIQQYLKLADVLVMNSKAESFCLAALEALGCGVPVISTDVGGISELIKFNINGYLFKEYDYDSPVRYIIDMFNNQNKYNTLSRNAVATAHAYDVQKIIPLYEKLYSTSLQKEVRIKIA